MHENNIGSPGRPAGIRAPGDGAADHERNRHRRSGRAHQEGETRTTPRARRKDPNSDRSRSVEAPQEHLSDTLVDSSAWIAFFRGEHSAVRRIDRLLAEGRVATWGPIAAEVLSGVPSRKEFDLLRE